MNHRNFSIIWCFCAFLLVLPHIATASHYTEEVLSEKRMMVAMRMIGHELLKCTGDGSSRVLPIQKEEGFYKISFEDSLGFDPEDLIRIVNGVMTETGVTNNYLVEVVKCDSREIVHIFEMNLRMNPDVIACSGRALPNDCYQLLVTILDGPFAVNISRDNGEVALENEPPGLPFKSTFLLIPLVMLIGAIGYIKGRNALAKEDPYMISIGSSQFDKKNMTLSHKDGSVDLSNKESALLLLLHSSMNEPVKREVILKKVWGDEGAYIGRTLDVFISKLRKKLEPDSSVRIVNIRGVGYKLVV